MNDLETLRSADPAAAVRPDQWRTHVDAHLAAARTEPQPGRAGRSRHVWAGALGAVIALGLSGVAYAVAQQNPQTVSRINCAAGVSAEEVAAGRGFTSVIDSRTGDPVADCARAYRQLGEAAPALAAYSSPGNASQRGISFVHVVPADAPVPADWQPLDVSFRQDERRIELRDRLADRINSAAAGCLNREQATRVIDDELTAVRLVGWRIVIRGDGARADGQSLCAIATPADDGSHEVRLAAVAPVGE